MLDASDPTLLGRVAEGLVSFARRLEDHADA
jgi:hypothetical protein